MNAYQYEIVFRYLFGFVEADGVDFNKGIVVRADEFLDGEIGKVECRYPCHGGEPTVEHGEDCDRCGDTPDDVQEFLSVHITVNAC